MSYLDDIASLLDLNRNGDEDDANDDVIDVEPTEPLEIARHQLENARAKYHEGPEGTFRTSGSRFGCGYAEGVATVDPETGKCEMRIETNLYVSPQNIPSARKLFRRLNQDFIISGLTVGDDGWVRFIPENQPLLLEGDDLSEYFSKGFSTVHAHTPCVAMLESGRSPRAVLAAVKRKDDDDDDDTPDLDGIDPERLEALSRLFS